MNETAVVSCCAVGLQHWNWLAWNYFVQNLPPPRPEDERLWNHLVYQSAVAQKTPHSRWVCHCPSLTAQGCKLSCSRLGCGCALLLTSEWRSQVTSDGRSPP